MRHLILSQWRGAPPPRRTAPLGGALLLLAGTLATLSTMPSVRAQSAAAPGPKATLVSAPAMRLTGAVDSNSPAIWEVRRGRPILHVLTSFAGRPSVAAGSSLAGLSAARETDIVPWPPGGNWMEAVVSDDHGTWYGYYHNEHVADDVCPGTRKFIPRIGAARSTDHGLTWENLGIILEAPRGTHDCASTNRYFVGGIGDLSVMLDPESRDLYIFFSEYLRQRSLQGVAMARLLWAHRDEPAGKVMVWNDGVWLRTRGIRMPGPDTESTSDDVIRWLYPPAAPFYRAADSWHDGNAVVDAFWGPSVHWNTYLQQYVMLLNRAKNGAYDSEGIYVAFAPRLDDPGLWSAPVRILSGGSWYPQVMGTELGTGTDKIAGETARFFMSGRSSHFIRFSK